MNAEKIKVVPKQGLRVVNPDAAQPGQPLPALPPEGAVVDRSSYWERRIEDGDVTFEPVQEKAAKAAK